jgi:hypothetical protein
MGRGTDRFLLLATLVVATAVLAPLASAARFGKVDRTVIASLPEWHGAKAHIVDQLDLTPPFRTRARWILVAAKFIGPPPAALNESEDGGPLVVCLAREMTPTCSDKFPKTGSSTSWFDAPYHFLSGRVVFAGAGHTEPLLLVKTATAHSLNGSHGIETQLFTYDRQTDHFESVFSNSTGSNNNQQTRFAEEGPLRGDIIVAEPTRDAPYAYWISVYTRDSEGRYSHPALRYRSATRYGDGNRLPVIDSDMPNILARLGKRRGEPRRQ